MIQAQSTSSQQINWQHFYQQSSARFTTYWLTFLEENQNQFKILTPEHENIINSINKAYQVAKYEDFLKSLKAIYQYLNSRGLYDLSLSLMEKAFSLPTSKMNQNLLLHCYLNSALLYERVGQLDVANQRTQEGFALAKQAKARAFYPSFISQAAIVAFRLGKTQEAIELIESGFALVNKSLQKSDYVRLLDRKILIVEGMGKLNEMLGLLKQLLGLIDQKEEPDIYLRTITRIGTTYFSQGLYDEAEKNLVKALSLAKQINDVPMELVIQVNRGTIQQIRGDLSKSRSIYKSCLSRTQKTGLIRLTWNIMANIGLIDAQTGDFDEAEIFLNRCLKLAQEIDDYNLFTASLTDNAYLNSRRGNYEAAHNYLQEALVISKNTEAKVRICRAYKGLSHVDAHLGRLAEARNWGEQGVLIAQEENYRNELAWLRYWLAYIEFANGSFALAEEHIINAVAIFDTEEMKFGFEQFLELQGAIFQKKGRFNDARKAYEQLFQLDSSASQETNILAHIKLAVLFLENGMLFDARNHIDNALIALDSVEIKERIKAAEAFSDIGCYFLGTNDIALAIQYLERSINIARQIATPYVLCVSLCRLGEALYLKEELSQVSDVFLEALKISAERRFEETAAYARYGLAKVNHYQERTGLAEKYAKESLDWFQKVAHHEAKNSELLSLANS